MQNIDTGKYGILYVDDEPDNLTVFKAAFRRHYNIYLANSAKEGMAVLNQSDIQLIITDQRMPEISGLEFLKTAVKKHPKIIRMILTGYSDIDVVIRSINQGRIYRYVTKPWDKNELKMIIDNALETYSLKNENRVLLKNLKKANLKLEEYSADLEQKVIERTHVLEKNMALLEREIIERKKAEQAIRESEKAAAAANESKSKFLARISHDMRTPISAILGFTELMQVKFVEEKFQIYLDAISSSGETLLSLVNDVLDISRIEAGKLTLEYSYVDLRAIFNDIKQIFLWKVKDKGLNLKVEIDETMPSKIILDEARLRQILFNLLGNAFKFTENGFIKLAVIKCDRHTSSDDYLDYVISVQDSGCGIPKSQQKKIFGEYAQQKGRYKEKQSGTGLGLAITKDLVELMGCQITLTSTVGMGSDFRIYLANRTELPESVD
ncbi:ATP-binding protein [Desulfococcaceae bacterium HSG7]|nr:ATP-binding protein [Desulfococcaceae bacterium HSG7]